MKRLLLPIALATLAGCVSYKVGDDDGTRHARIGQAARIANFEVTPLEVLEDSRCPSNVQCIWEGRLRFKARIDFDSSVSERELTLGEPQPVGSGMLTLAEAAPYPEQGTTIYPEDYRFGFTYVPNIAN